MNTEAMVRGFRAKIPILDDLLIEPDELERIVEIFSKEYTVVYYSEEIKIIGETLCIE